MAELQIRGMRGGYPAAEEIVKGIDLTVHGGDYAVIIGPNGAGKSTLLKLVAGLLTPSGGEVQLNGNRLKPGHAQMACGAGLSFVPQERNVFPTLTVRENLEMGGFLDRRTVRQRMERQLERFPLLKGRLRDRAGNLSGGQRQVLAMAIALMTEPEVLLLDEPTAGLSPAAADDVFALIQALAQSGLAILMVEQNALLALEFGTRGIVLVAGRKVRDESARGLLEDDEIRHLFLGNLAALPSPGAVTLSMNGGQHVQV